MWLIRRSQEEKNVALVINKHSKYIKISKN